MPRLFLISALCLILLSVLAHGSRGRPASLDIAAGAAAPDEVLVRLRPAAMSLSDAVLSERLGAGVSARLPALATLRLRLPPDEAVAAAVARIGRLPLVERAEPNYRLHGAAIPNDPVFSAQSAYLGLIEAPAAWDIEVGDAAVLVAVLDSGIDLAHPDLEGKVWTNALETDNGRDDDRNGCIDDRHGCSFLTSGPENQACGERPAAVVDDDNGHGTFTAGIIAASANNATGMTGAAPGVTIVPVKILDCLGAGTAGDAAEGLLYAARVGARVANISFSADGDSFTLANAIRAAYERNSMVIVAATGNEGAGRVNFPARLAETIAVASSGMTADAEGRSAFSNWGPEVTVAAPGLNIIGPVPAAFCGQGWLCLPDQPYAVASGTSFAAPLVSSLAALLVSHNANLSPESVRRLIVDTAAPLPDRDTPGWAGAGRIRMRVALAQPRFFLGVAGVARD